jgi:hypothetical protein
MSELEAVYDVAKLAVHSNNKRKIVGVPIKMSFMATSEFILTHHPSS